MQVCLRATRRAAVLLSLCCAAFPAHAVLVDETQSFFVSVDGNDANPGTRAAPFATIRLGVLAAMSPVKKNVLIGAGTYTGPTIVLPNGVSLYGGYDPASGWTRSPANVTTFNSTSTNGIGISILSYTAIGVVDGLTISTTTVGGAPSTSSIAVAINNSPGIALRYNTLLPGVPRAGATGASGSAGAEGNNG